MKKVLLVIIVLTISCKVHPQEIARVDPNHTKEGGYGYLIQTDPTCSVWWAEGAYKVMRDAPIPARDDNEIRIWSAKNEFEPFIIVIYPNKRMENFRIALTDLKDGSGNTIHHKNLTIRKVEYVRVSKPTDAYGTPGWWPDPLPLFENPETIMPSENRPFWISLKVPAEIPGGIYTGDVVLSSGEWKLVVPLKLTVWDFTLPKTPSIRSGFGMNMNTVVEYDNLTEPEDQKRVFEYYMESYRDYKISPYNPFLFSTIHEEVHGVAWHGGIFDSKDVYEGMYSYQLMDSSASENIEGSTKDLIPVHPRDPYQFSWMAKSLQAEQLYVVGIECYNAEKKKLIFENRFEIFTGSDAWESNTLNLGTFGDEIRFVKIRLFPSNRTRTGEDMGTVWFDNISLMNSRTKKNEFPAGNFEVQLDNIDIQMDFTDFNRAGRRYFDEFGFNGYRLALKGLGGGTYYSRENGIFEGFEQGTEEYHKLMERYLAQMQNNLEKNGWLGKEYIYWFDEPGEQDYPFVRETNALIKQYAPKITTFLTEHVSGQDISDVTDISCTIWHKLDHDKISAMNEKGLEYWSYLCCWPKSPWISEFIDHDAINLRMWLWASWQYRLKGILIWSTTYWNSAAASPEGYLQNPWEEPMSFVTGYGWPLGKQTIWGNGDGRFFYPLNRDPNNDFRPYVGRPVPSLRLEILRDGIEDYEYFVMLEKALKNSTDNNKRTIREAMKLLKIPEEIYTNETTYSKDPQDIIQYRKKLAEYIVLLGNNESP